MTVADKSSIRALERGLAVLQLINRAGSMSVTEVAAAAGLPHPTAIRIVRTLVTLGFVEREPSRRHYRPTALVQSLSCGFQAHDRLVAAARPLIVELTKTVGWPLAIVTRVGGQMVARDSTVALTSLTFNIYQPGITLPIFSSASGQIWFAHASAEEQAEMLAQAEAFGDPNERLLLGRFRDGAAAEQIRRHGYAAVGETPHPMNQRRNASLAVPILAGGRIEGALTLVYFANAMSPAEAAKRYQPALGRAAAQIGEALRERI